MLLVGAAVRVREQSARLSRRTKEDQNVLLYGRGVSLLDQSLAHREQITRDFESD